MNTIKTIMLLVIIALLSACSSEDAPKNNPPVLEDMALDVRENISSDLITTIIATDLDEDTLIYSIVSQTPVNSVTINSTNGEIYVSDARSFDYDLNPSITVTIKVSDGKSETTARLVITITNAS
tara:strand:+ start:1370 stop:1744 length:375 start_codon:yes stop_codon:yes gene_type:complete